MLALLMLHADGTFEDFVFNFLCHARTVHDSLIPNIYPPHVAFMDEALYLLAKFSWDEHLFANKYDAFC